MPPNSFQRAKQRDGTGPTVPPCISLSIFQRVFHSGGRASTPSTRRTGHSCSLLSFPEAVAWRVAVLHTHPQWGRGAGVVPASSGSPETLSLCLTRQGERLALLLVGTFRQDSHVDPKSSPLASGCTDFLGSSECVVQALIQQVLALWPGLWPRNPLRTPSL